MFQKKVKEITMIEEEQLVPIKKEKKSKGNKDVKVEIEKKAQEKLDAIEEDVHQDNTDENILKNAR